MKKAIIFLILVLFATPAFCAPQQVVNYTVTYAATKALQPVVRGETQYYMADITGNCAISIGKTVRGDICTFFLTSDAVGGHVMTFGNYFTPTSTLTLIASETSVIQFIYTGSTWKETWRINGTSGTPVLPITASQGDILYASATDTWANLVKNTTATRYLANTGTDNNPAWNQVNLTNGVTGTLLMGNGGTGSAIGNVIADSTPDSDHSITGATIFTMTAHENMAIGDICYVNADGECQIADADAEATARCFFVCADATIAADATGNFAYIPSGFILRDDTFNFATKGAWVYLSTTGTTGNTWTTTAPSGTDDCIIPLGVVLTADIIAVGHLGIVIHE